MFKNYINHILIGWLKSGTAHSHIKVIQVLHLPCSDWLDQILDSSDDSMDMFL